MHKDSVLLIFTRAPVLGQVKTRLIPTLGKQQATKLYEALLLKTLQTASRSDFDDIEIWVDGDTEHSFFSTIRQRYGFRFYQQTGADLGLRMHHALKHALQRYQSAVLIGCDCAELTVDDLNSGRASLLNGADVIMGPANDGGYYMIGIKQANVALFSDVAWSTDSVAEDTRARIKSLGWQLEEKATHTDIDVPADLQTLVKPAIG